MRLDPKLPLAERILTQVKSLNTMIWLGPKDCILKATYLGPVQMWHSYSKKVRLIRSPIEFDEVYMLVSVLRNELQSPNHGKKNGRIP